VKFALRGSGLARDVQENNGVDRTALCVTRKYIIARATQNTRGEPASCDAL